MEVAGLAIGIAGLSGLFTACIDCFELVQRGRYLGHDYVLLERKFANQRIRLVTWGQACGFTKNHYDTRIDEDPQVRDAIELTLAHLFTLLSKGDNLRQNYGLRDEDPTKSRPKLASSFFNGFLPSRHMHLSRFGNRLQELEANIKSTQKSPSTLRTARWVIEDKRKFSELVQHIKDFIDDLEGFTRQFDTEQCQRKLINTEIESIREISILEAIEEARTDCEDPVANAASFRLHQATGDSNRCNDISDNTFPTHTIKGSGHDEWEVISTNDTVSPASDQSIQILYRVSCPNGSRVVYFDPPTYSSSDCDASQWVFLDADNPRLKPRLSHMCGKKKLPNFEAYVAQNNVLEFVVFKDYKCDHKHRSDLIHPSPICESVYLLSTALCDVLDKVIGHTHPQISVPGIHVSAQFASPYVWYYRLRESLPMALGKVKEMQIDTSPVARLFDFIEESMAVEYAIVDEQLATGNVSWHFLKYLYYPGDVVMENNNGRDYPHAQAFEIHGELIPVDCEVYRNGMEALELWMFRLEFDSNIRDRSVKAQFQNVKFHRSLFDGFDNKVPIGMLPILTIQYITNVSRAELIERGKKLMDCQRKKYVEYTSIVEASRRLPRSDRFFIDPVLYLKSLKTPNVEENKNETLNALQLANLLIPDWYRGCTTNGLNDKALLLLPSTIWGFDLRMHKWRKLSIRDIEPIQWGAPSLLLQGFHDSLLLRRLDYWANVDIDEKVRASPPEDRHGLFLLFSGCSGMEKERASKYIAERTRRPIYHLVVGDGVEAKKAINTAMDCARAWGCVLLLENVDILTMRSFMCLLEGFRGILILTTAVNVDSESVLPETVLPEVDFILNFPQSEKEEPCHPLGVRLRPVIIDDVTIYGY
ncbi:prion-inhibition and propagation-domain-containing protein [Xylaria scruposa]|nr:prion-inhibition and propagation-domain-containing protein [Xylaria scruposa]